MVKIKFVINCMNDIINIRTILERWEEFSLEYIEQERMDAFECAIKSMLIKELPNFESVYRELQGSADFVGFPHEKVIGTYDFSNLSSLEHSSLVLSILKYNSGRTKEYIKERTGIADTSLNRTLRELKSNKPTFSSENSSNFSCKTSSSSKGLTATT